MQFDAIIEIHIIGKENIIAVVGENGACFYLPNLPFAKNYEITHRSA